MPCDVLEKSSGDSRLSKNLHGSQKEDSGDSNLLRSVHLKLYHRADREEDRGQINDAVCYRITQEEEHSVKAFCGWHILHLDMPKGSERPALEKIGDFDTHCPRDT